METVSEFRQISITLNENIDCGKLCGMIGKNMAEYFTKVPNDGNNVLVITIKRIVDSTIVEKTYNLEYKNPDLQQVSTEPIING